MQLYEVRIRFQGSITTVQVQARDAGHAKALVNAQYGGKVDVMEATTVRK